ncbi:MAG: ABC transporter permease, partial [bacterium]
IGVTTVILMAMIINGLNQSFQGQISSLGSGTLYIQRFPWIPEGDFFSYRNRPYITLKDYEAVRQSSKLAEVVSLWVYTQRSVSFGAESLENVIIMGTDEAYIEAADVLPEVGRFISKVDAEANRSVAVIGADVAEKLLGQYNPIGQSIRVQAYKFKVIGVLEKRGTSFGQSMDNQVIVPLGALMKHFGRRRDLGIIVKATDPERLEELKDELTGILRRSRRLAADQENNFSINEQEQLMRFYTTMTSTVYAAGFIIGGLSLLVGGIGIMNIMLVSVTERTHEIGIRKALGARRGQILSQFLFEAVLICSFGGLVGIFAAWGCGKIISKWLPSVLTPDIAIVGILFAALIGIFFGLFPAAKAARLDPVVALRQE